MKKHVGLRLPEELAIKYKGILALQGLTVQKHLEEVIKEYVNEQKKNHLKDELECFR